MPLPFYAYSIAYGSVPIFIPVWWPHSWYNTRYGMEMLPAFALFRIRGGLEGLATWRPRWQGWMVPVTAAADCDEYGAAAARAAIGPAGGDGEFAHAHSV